MKDRDPNPPPRIGIVTPSFEQGEFLEECLLSVASQSFQDREHIVVDGGSTDSTLATLERHGDHLSHWLSEADDGPAEAIEKGWGLTRAPIVAWLNADDVYLPGALATVAKAFDRHPQAVAVCGSQLFVDRDGRVLSVKRVQEASYASLLDLHFLPQPAFFLRRDAVDAAGGMDRSEKLIFDYELFLRVLRQGEAVVVPQVLAATRWHPDTITLARQAEIGAALARVVGLHSRNRGGPEQPGGRHLRWKVLRLAGVYQVQAGRPLRAVPFALRSILNAPHPAALVGTIRTILAELKAPRSPAQRYAGVAPGPRWSEWEDPELHDAASGARR